MRNRVWELFVIFPDFMVQMSSLSSQRCSILFAISHMLVLYWTKQTKTRVSIPFLSIKLHSRHMSISEKKNLVTADTNIVVNDSYKM